MRPFGLNEFLYVLSAAQWTIYLTALAFLLGGLGGLAIALVRTSKLWPLSLVAMGWVRLFQNTPLLVQLFLVYYGLALLGYQLPAVVAGAIGLTFWSSAFLGEIWRGCIQAVPRPQWEAASSIALSGWQTRYYVILPQALRIAVPPTIGFVVQLIKNSSLLSVVGIMETMRAASTVNQTTSQPLLVFLIAAAIYFAMCFPLTVLSRKLERRLNASHTG